MAVQILSSLRVVSDLFNSLPGPIQVLIWLPWGALLPKAIINRILDNGNG